MTPKESAFQKISELVERFDEQLAIRIDGGCDNNCGGEVILWIKQNI
jgi:hypothetical protein